MACLLSGSDRDRMPADVVRPRHPGVRQRRSARRCRGLTGALNLSERRRGPVLPPATSGRCWEGADTKTSRLSQIIKPQIRLVSM